ncbi:hypothetical protein TRICI_003936 [Trichomonascus ciferrii]|uniref:Actin n=1 Tax=Trichomonascus ciferrii TaxID=44093 RepID=A0A642V2D6_9ASCO|nr:hypothetical protein TRICI_003936 [Trichomonascus ciferrii]
MEVSTCMEDGIVQDWEAATKLWEHGIRECLYADPSDHPVLLTEQIWNPDENRARAMEFFFETLDAPAFYAAKSPVCSLFASGKGSGLVVDVGADVTTVTPVIDGLVLYRPARRTRLAGNHLNERVQAMFSEQGITVTPRYRVLAKEVVDVGEAAQYTARDFAFSVTDTFAAQETARVLEEFKETCVEAEGEDEKEAVFEFPDGYRHRFSAGARRAVANEALFQSGATADDALVAVPDAAADEAGSEPTTKTDVDALTTTDRTTGGFSTRGVVDLIADTIQACDVDVRANLANNIVLTGGTTLLTGFTQRVNQELTQTLSGLKVRIHAPGNTIERRNSAWIGGSILASLGTFHQLWISKKEYEEVGVPKLLEKRFR